MSVVSQHGSSSRTVSEGMPITVSIITTLVVTIEQLLQGVQLKGPMLYAVAQLLQDVPCHMLSLDIGISLFFI